ncbi:MAG: ATP-binding protein [Nitrosopumilus sp.]|nr:ATP-binding protein [Nitrosopumilus sp.]
MKIAKKLILSFICMGVLIGLIGYLAIYFSESALEDSITQDAVVLSKKILNDIDKNIYTRIVESQELASDPRLQTSLKISNENFDKIEDVEKYIDEIDMKWRSTPLEENNSLIENIIDFESSQILKNRINFYEKEYEEVVFAEIFTTNKYGVNVAQSSVTSDYKQNDEEWWQIAKNNGWHINDVDFDDSAGIYSIDISVRVNDEDGNFLGVMKSVVNINNILVSIQEAKSDSTHTSTQFELINKNNQIIFSTEQDWRLFEDAISRPYIKTVIEGKDHVIIKENELMEIGNLYSFSYSEGYRNYDGLGWILILKYDTQDVLSSVLALKFIILGLSILIGTVAISFGLLISRSIAIPIKEKDNLLLVLDEFALVSFTDNQGNITHANEKFCETSKYSMNELIGQNHRILKSDYHPQSFYKNMWDTISSGKIWNNEIKNKAKDGSLYWVKTIIAPIFDYNGKIERYISIRTDITKNKENEETIKSQFQRLKKIEAEKGEFLSMITHELRSPLTPIVGWCDALKNPKILGNLDGKQIKAVNTILNNALKLQRLISDLLDAQKLEMGKMSFEKSEFNVLNLMDMVLNNFEQTIKTKNIVLVNLTKDEIILKSDEKRIEQVLTNLINNSIDFVSKDTGRIEINCKNEETDVIFEVKDNGPGIEKEKQKLLFKKFYQADTSLKREHGGTGLGLNICKGIVEGLKGEIIVNSVLGKGTSFIFRIPKEN